MGWAEHGGGQHTALKKLFLPISLTLQVPGWGGGLTMLESPIPITRTVKLPSPSPLFRATLHLASFSQPDF